MSSYYRISLDSNFGYDNFHGLKHMIESSYDNEKLEKLEYLNISNS